MESLLKIISIRNVIDWCVRGYNLDVSIDEDTSTIKIIDASYVPDIPTNNQVLEIYGYDGSTSNFVYDFNIKTEITNDFATMASIGSPLRDAVL